MNELIFINTILELIIKYGLPATVQIIKIWQVEGDITKEDIEKLKNIKPPREFFD